MIKKRFSKRGEVWMGIYFFVMAIILFYLTYCLWLQFDPDKAESQLILIVLAAGAMGSYFHAATSFVTYAGNRTLGSSWAWWYILRPFIGMAIALVFYFLIRGGLLLTVFKNAPPADLNPHGIAALAALAGMFSKQAADKMDEFFTQIFKMNKDVDRKDKVGDFIGVTERMTKLKHIIDCTIPEGKSSKDILVTDLTNMLIGMVTRIPVFDHQHRAQYVIHGSLLHKFIAEKCSKLADKAERLDVRIATLADFLGYPDMLERVSTMVFISQDSTLFDAKLKMGKKQQCQDVFITEKGTAQEPIKGWLTNVDIMKNLED